MATRLSAEELEETRLELIQTIWDARWRAQQIKKYLSQGRIDLAIESNDAMLAEIKQREEDGLVDPG